jgi:NADPH:quinone reductase-like Zn-dependent oxidoreductase
MMQATQVEEHPTEEEIDETLAETFPASDPPQWTLGTEDPVAREKKVKALMRAIVVDPSARFGLRLGEVPEPVPGPGQVLVNVHHTSLYYGELTMARSGRFPPGTVLGWDASGIVAVAAADGSGPAVGSRVVTRGPNGGWAQRRAVDVTEMAVVPDAVHLADAATLPVAAGTALQALRAAGPTLGRRVLITGASGGVGRFAVQLADRGGAYVIASVGSQAHGEGLTGLGADEVVVGLDGVDEPVDVILDTVGGPQMVRAFELLAPGGSLQSIGWTSGEPACFPPYSTVGPAKSITSFMMSAGLGKDLATLLALMVAGQVKAEIGWRGPWERFEEAIEALLARRVKGKAVLDVEPYRA